MKYDLGFLGGGQLARMSIQAAQRMGLRCISLDPSDHCPASFIADHLRGELHEVAAISEILDSAEFVTLENEFIPSESIEMALATRRTDSARLAPGVESLALVQDKLRQRNMLRKEGVPSPHAVAIEGDGDSAIAEIGFPMVLKLRFGGYDGKGTKYAKNESEFFALRELWGAGGWLAEQFVPFRRELAVMVAVGTNATLCFPTVETVQRNSVCDLVFPCDADAEKIAKAAVGAVKGTGLFGVELFQLESGEILVNELAPRPHNTGHYTLDWGGPSQFEYHVRSVLGLPIETPASNSFAVMANLLGQAGASDYMRGARAALETPNCFVHWYQKQEAKPGRKMGHLNVVGKSLSDLDLVISNAKRAQSAFYEAWTRQ